MLNTAYLESWCQRDDCHNIFTKAFENLEHVASIFLKNCEQASDETDDNLSSNFDDDNIIRQYLSDFTYKSKKHDDLTSKLLKIRVERITFSAMIDNGQHKGLSTGAFWTTNEKKYDHNLLK